MQTTTLLLRQVHPKFVQNGQILDLAFRPFPKDEGLLSVYDGDMITAEDSFKHYTGSLNRKSSGVWAVTVSEAQDCALQVRPDVEGFFPEHAVIDFTGHLEKEQKAKSKILASKAAARGFLFKPE